MIFDMSELRRGRIWSGFFAAMFLCSSSARAAGPSLPPTSSSELVTPESSSQQAVPFEIGLGMVWATLPGSPGPVDTVAQNLYRFRLQLSFLLWDADGAFSVPCRIASRQIGGASERPGCDGFSTRTVLKFGADALYPSTVKVITGRVSSLLRFAPTLAQEVTWKPFDGLVSEVSGELGWALEKMQYGSTSLTVSSPRLGVDARLLFPGLKLIGGVPCLLAGATLLSPFFRYSSNGDETPLEIDGSNVTVLSSAFSTKGSGYRWEASGGLGMSFAVASSELTTSLTYRTERGSFTDLRQLKGYRSTVESGKVSMNGFLLGLSRSF